MDVKEIINQIEKIKIEDDTNGSESWIAVGVDNVRTNSKIGRELLANGFRKDSFYGLIYVLHGNLKEKEMKAKSLQDLLCGVFQLKTQIYDRGL